MLSCVGKRVKRPDAPEAEPRTGYAADGEPTLAVLAQLGSPDGCGRALSRCRRTWGRARTRSAARKLTASNFGAARPGVPTGQRDRFRPPDCRWDGLATEGRTGLPILGFRPPMRPCTAGRSLGSRCRTDATNTCQNSHRAQEWFCSTLVPSTGVPKPHGAHAHQRGLRGSGLRTGRDGPES